MKKSIPKISVYIITYNQEDVIRRTLDSVISQLDYVYEICISDDHSTDKTWEIVEEYSSRFPGLFKLNRNETNLGIFENTEKVWTMPSGDIVHDLAGDDCVGEGWFKNVVDYININNIDYKNEYFCIYGDYKCIYPNGDTVVYSNKLINKHINPLSLALQEQICNRSSCYSIKILKNFSNVSQGKSHIAENVQDRQLQIFTEKSYYIPRIGNIYYTNIGISAHENDDIKKERAQIIPYTINYFDINDIRISKRDFYYLKYKENRHYKTFVSQIKSVVYYLLSCNWLFFIIGNDLKRIVFGVIRRIPHTKPVTM